MNPTDTITLTAFLAALTQLDSPLPPEVQTQLKKFGSVDDITANIGQLNAIAENYPDLDEHYQKAREILQLPVSERSKGPLPKINHLTEREITEITNIAREVATSQIASAVILTQPSEKKDPLEFRTEAFFGSLGIGAIAMLITLAILRLFRR